MWLSKLLWSKLLLDKLLLLNRSSKLLRGSGSCKLLRGSIGPDNTKSKRADLWLNVYIGFSLNLLVDVGLCSNLLMHIGHNLRGSVGGSGQAN